MQLSISNIAWDTELDEAVAEILSREGVHCIDIAPGKYFADFATVTSDDINAVRRFWEKHGIKVVGMQSLLFGTRGLNLFDRKTQPALLQHLKFVRRIAIALGVERLTFGSPRNRDRTGLTDEQADAVAKSFFRRRDAMREDGTSNPRLLLEPNPVLYGANFLTTTESAIEFVSSLAIPSIGLQLDLGTMTVNGEKPEVIDQSASVVGHIHVSEPNLVPVGTTNAPHAIYAKHLRMVPAKYLTIEMIEKKPESQIEALKASVQFVKHTYAEVLE